MKQKYNDRLLRLAYHIERYVSLEGWNVLKPGEPLIEDSGEYFLRVHYWALTDLPILFPEHFAYDQDSEIYPLFTDDCLVHSLLQFLNLEPAEFMHLFTPNMQSPHLYGGMPLAENALPENIARNIYDMVSRRMMIDKLSECKNKFIN
jgi:hypothetical protein